jgi:hypothetical protein
MLEGSTAFVALLLAVGICIATLSPWALLAVAAVVFAIAVEPGTEGPGNRREERERSDS